MNRTLLISGMLLATAPAFAQHSSPMRRAHAVAANPPFSQSTLIAGRVTVADGKPAGNAQVFLSWTTDRGETQLRQIGVDSKGSFGISIKLTPKPNGNVVMLTAASPGQGIVTQQTSLADKSLGKLNLKLLPSTILTGQIIRPDGSPVANTTVALETLTSPSAMTMVNGVAVGADGTPMQAAMPQQATMVLLMPSQALPLFHAQTDATGRFTLTGLPVGAQVGLKLGKGLLFSSGSMNAITLRMPNRQDAGLLVAVQPGRIKLHLTDRQTSKAAVGAGAQLVSANAMTFGASGMPIVENIVEDELTPVDSANLALSNRIAVGGPGSFNSFAQTDVHGDLEFANLRPGDYRLLVQGRTLPVHVAEGQTVAPIQLALRQGELHGRLLDPQGKPLADVPIQVLNGTPHNLVGPNFQVRGGNASSCVKSGTDGSFTFTAVPWGSPALTIRAIHGNDLAEWSGSPDKLGRNLVLKMQANALVTIKGRLIDPQRHPVTNLTFQTLHWLDSPRSTWFATAHQAHLDAQGNFRIEGLERGESFSLVTGANENDGRAVAHTRVLTEEVRAVPQVARVASFESPRFTTPQTGQVQDLGEMMIHPEQDPGDILQIYGDEDPIEQARLSGFLPSPSVADVQAARQALAQYQTALKTRDLDTLYKLASHLSLGWSSDRRAFLEQCSLVPFCTTDPANSNSVRALPLVPRSLAAEALRFSAAGQGVNGSAVDAIVRALDRNPDLVFLAEQRANHVTLAGILRKEEGVWRVLALPSEIESLAEPLNAADSQDRSNFTRVASLPEALQTDARQIAENYLQAWAQNRFDNVLDMTSPLSSLHTAKVEEFKQRLAARPDEGICPLTAEDTVALQPVDNLTVWDHKQLINMIFQGQTVVGNRMAFSRVLQEGVEAPQQDPAAIARHADTAFFRYTSAGQSYLIALMRYDGKWTVLEPALPM